MSDLTTTSNNASNPVDYYPNFEQLHININDTLAALCSSGAGEVCLLSRSHFSHVHFLLSTTCKLHYYTHLFPNSACIYASISTLSFFLSRAPLLSSFAAYTYL